MVGDLDLVSLDRAVEDLACEIVGPLRTLDALSPPALSLPHLGSDPCPRSGDRARYS